MKKWILFKTGKNESTEPKASPLGRYGGAFMLFILCSFSAWSQTSSVQLSNLRVSLRIISDNQGNVIHKTCAPVDSLFMDISFTVSDVVSCSKAHIYMGTAQDSMDVRNIEATFSQVDTSFYLNYNGAAEEVKNNKVLVIPKFSKAELKQYHYISVFIEDNSGYMSNRVYFNK